MLEARKMAYSFFIFPRVVSEPQAQRVNGKSLICCSKGDDDDNDDDNNNEKSFLSSEPNESSFHFSHYERHSRSSFPLSW